VWDAPAVYQLRSNCVELALTFVAAKDGVTVEMSGAKWPYKIVEDNHLWTCQRCPFRLIVQQLYEADRTWCYSKARWEHRNFCSQVTWKKVKVTNLTMFETMPIMKQIPMYTSIVKKFEKLMMEIMLDTA